MNFVLTHKWSDLFYMEQRHVEKYQANVNFPEQSDQIFLSESKSWNFDELYLIQGAWWKHKFNSFDKKYATL